MEQERMIRRKKDGIFIVISGPSGVGKGTICQKLLKKLNAWYSISMTSRRPREGEKDGVNYYFVSKEEFQYRITQNEFLEYAIYNNEYYGTPKEKILNQIKSGVDVFSEIEVQGAKQIKSIYPDALLIYVLPPSMEELKNRLIKRNTESKDKIRERMSIAYKELEKLYIYDYAVINDDLETTVNEIKNIIEAERHKINRIEIDIDKK